MKLGKIVVGYIIMLWTACRGKFTFVESQEIGPLTRTMWTVFAGALLVSGCQKPPSAPEVVIGCTVQPAVADPVLKEFETLTKITPVPKGVGAIAPAGGLVPKLEAEKNHPPCDVFWDDELLTTLQLDRLGLLDSYFTPESAGMPARYRSPQNTWYGFAARARVLLVNTDKLTEEQRPKSIRDLVDSQYQGQVGISSPLHGTMAMQAACLFVAWEREEAETFFRALKQNAKLLEDGWHVANEVGSGRLLFGLVDSDAAIISIEHGLPVTIVYPDQAEGELGTLFVPNSVAILKNAANPRPARELVDYLITGTVEETLAAGPGALIPLNQHAKPSARLPHLHGVRPMLADFVLAEEQWEATRKFLAGEFPEAKP